MIDSCCARSKGLAVGFVLSLDNVAPKALITHETSKAVVAWSNATLNKLDVRDLRRQAHATLGASFVLTVVVIMRTWGLLTAGELKCDEIAMFLFYRVGVGVCLWWMSLTEELLLFVYRALAVACGLVGQRPIGQRPTAAVKETARPRLWQHEVACLLRSTARSGLAAFFGSLCAALVVTATIWLFFQMHWDTDLAYAVQHYLWHFTLDDIFGACGSGGYVMSFPDGECSKVTLSW